MSHVIEDKDKLLARVRRMRGQVEAVERALEADLGCAAVLQLAASIRGALNGMMAELVEHHLASHVVGEADPTQRRAGAEELAQVIRTYLR